MNRHWVNENELQITCHRHMSRALAGPLIRCYSILKRLMFRTMYSVGVWVCVCVCLGGIGEREAHTLDVHRSNSSLHSNCMWKKCQFFFVLLVNIVRVHRKISTYDDDDKRKQRRCRVSARSGTYGVVSLKSASKWNENLWNCKM